jgi:hypothetical protein
MQDTLDFLTNIMPSIIAINHSINAYYINEKNMITFLVTFIKIIVVSLSLLYISYLYFVKQQIIHEVSIKTQLITNLLTLIFGLISIYLIYSRSDEVKEKVNEIKNKIKNKL